MPKSLQFYNPPPDAAYVSLKNKQIDLSAEYFKILGCDTRFRKVNCDEHLWNVLVRWDVVIQYHCHIYNVDKSLDISYYM